MSLFSQSLLIGENTLQELEKGAGLQLMNTTTPGRSSVGNNSDNDIIEESPTNASIYSIRERTKAKYFNKSKKKKAKSRSSEQLTTVSVVDTGSDCSKNTLSQFLRSEYDFGDEILKILPENTSDIKVVIDCDNEKPAEKVSESVQLIDDLQGLESDMFSQWVVPQNNCSLKASTQFKASGDQKDSSMNIWDDSYDFNDLDLSFKQDNAKPKDIKLEVDERTALGIDNVTFTQNFMNEAVSEETDSDSKVAEDESNTVATQKFFAEELENSIKSFTDEIRAECHKLSISHSSQMRNNFDCNISDSNFTLNYSDSTVENDEDHVGTQNGRPNLQPLQQRNEDHVASQNDNGRPNSQQLQQHNEDHVVSQNVNGKLNSQPQFKHQNSIDSWGLPASIVREYHRKKIINMFDWQRECLSKPKVLLENANLVYCAPTSAGKTLVSEILMIKNVLEKHKQVLVILPFVSVVREKMNYLQDLLTPSGIIVEGYHGGYMARSFDTVDVAICTIEKANSIVNKLLEQKKIDSIGCIVVDEVHMLSDPQRGYILELLLSKILYVNRKIHCNIQIVTMSATLPNLDLLTSWLGAEFYKTEYRPVDLIDMIKIDDKIFDNKMTLLRTVSTEAYSQFPIVSDNIGQLCVETIIEGGSVIVFCPAKAWCESLAEQLARFIYHIGKSKTDLAAKVQQEINFALIEETKALLKNCPTGFDSLLEKTVSYGVSFHHSSLTTDEREIVENAFKVGSLRIIVSTSTLSSGVNLPARRVIIRSPIFNRKMLDPLTYHQMIGRAGRTGRDTIGESILICDSTNKKTGQDLFVAKLKPLASCLGMDDCSNLKQAFLEIIAAGMANTIAELEAFCNCTLLATERKAKFKYQILEKDFQFFNGARSQDQAEEDGTNPIKTCMRFLVRNEFIRLQMNDTTNEYNFIATRLGSACLASSLTPSDGLILRSVLQKSREAFVLDSDLHAIYLVTPLSICYNITDIDWTHFLNLWDQLPAPMKRVSESVGVRESTLSKAIRGQKMGYKELQIHKRFYTALAFEELINEKSIPQVALKFKFPRGTLQSLQQMAAQFASTVASFCHALDWKTLARIIVEFKDRLYFGVHHDLVDLMKIPNLNSQRARSLFNEGIKNLTDLAKSNQFIIEKILYNSIGFDTKQRDGENEWDAEQRNKLRCFIVTGKSGMTISDAAVELIENARRCVEAEMGIENIDWSKHSKQSQSQNSQNRKQSQEVPAAMKMEAKKRKLNDGEAEYLGRNGQLYNKRLRRVSECESESESESGRFTMDTYDQSELIKTLIEYKSLNIIDVFTDKSFFDVVVNTIRNSSVIGFSVGVNQLPKAAPLIGLSSLMQQVNGVNRDIASYKCAFDEDKYIAGISLCTSGIEVYYLNMQDEANDDAAINFDVKVKFLHRLFHMEHLTLSMYDAKEQCKVLLKCFPQLSTFRVQLRDPLVASWLLDPEEHKNLYWMIRTYAPEFSGITDFVGIDKWHRRSIGLSCKTQVSPKMRCSVESCAVLHAINGQMEKLHNTNSKMEAAFTDIEMPIQRVLLTMELAGFPADEQRISEVASELADTLKNLEKLMFQTHGHNFNIKSKMEVAKVLGLNVNGKISTSIAVLEKLTHPIAKLMIQHATTEASLTGIIQPLIRHIVENRIYPRSSCFSSTGRVHLYEPSLQNVTKDFQVSTDSGTKTISCRRVFQASTDMVLISADFCQLELRILTHFSNDENLTKIMRSNCDVFKMIAAEWNNVTEAEVTDQQRNDSKQICYGIIYGMGVKTLAGKMKCGEAEAEKQQDLFLNCYPRIRNLRDRIVADAQKLGFVESISGRRRYLRDITSIEPAKRGKAERQAVNSTIQGSAADITKQAMLEMDKCISQNASTWKNVNLVLHIHDELVYEAPKQFAKEVSEKLRSSMENCWQLNVPLRVKAKIGRDWGTMLAVEGELSNLADYEDAKASKSSGESKMTDWEDDASSSKTTDY